MTHLKALLRDFSTATGLHINFHKSTFAPIHADDTLAASLAAILGCPVPSFHQSYLGLALSTHKLNLFAFFFISEKVDRWLAGWRGLLLSMAGSAILVRAAVRTLPIYAISALLLPLGMIQEIDRRCQGFFWVGQEKITEGQCKVAWDIVCVPFSHGGLGFSSLHKFNQCLLLKHLLKLHMGFPLFAQNHLSTTYGWTTSHDLGDSGRLSTAICDIAPMDSPCFAPSPK